MQSSCIDQGHLERISHQLGGSVKGIITIRLFGPIMFTTKFLNYSKIILLNYRKIKEDQARSNSHAIQSGDIESHLYDFLEG